MKWGFGRGRDRDIDDEIRAHLDMAARDRIDRGQSPTDARAQARREFGNVALVKEATRAAWRPAWLDSVAQDVRYAVRGCLRHPGFSVVAIFALGAAIGLNTSVFTVFNTLFLRTWPVHDPARVVQMEIGRPVTVADYQQLAADARTLSGIAAVTCEYCRARLNGRHVRITAVSSNFFSVLGVPMAVGRGFGAAEDAQGAPSAVVVLSHRLWQNEFGADRAIVGQRIVVNGLSVRVIGVAAQEFRGITISNAPEFWVPLAAVTLFESPPSSLERVRVVGRLAEGVSPAAAQAEVRALMGRETHAPGATGSRGSPAVTLSGATYFPRSKIEDAGALFGLMATGVLLVLLLACANVGNLLLARAAARTREVATRLSLGASRGRLIRQFLTESLVLAGAACAVGISLSFALPQLAFDWLASAAKRQEFAVAFVPDLTVVLFACGLAAVSIVAFGLAPALLASRQDIGTAMKERGGALAARVGPRRLLLSVQVATSVVLLVSTGLIARTARHALDVDLGFDVAGVAEVAVDVPPDAPVDRQAQSTQMFFERALEARPEQAAMEALAFRSASTAAVSRRGAEGSAAVTARVWPVTPNFFDVMKIPIVAGRRFDRATAGGIVVSESLAARHFPGTSPIGRTVIVDGQPREILAVAKDADLLGMSFTRHADRFAIYEPLSHLTVGTRMLVRRDRQGEDEALVALATSVSPGMALRVTPLTTRREELLADIRLSADLAGLVGMLALAITAVGISGVFGYIARQRTHEIGVRMALGGAPSQVVRGVFGPTIRALVVGMAVGLALSANAAPLLKGFVHPDVSGLDVPTGVAVVLMLSAAGIVATFGPLRIARSVAPVDALRHE